MLDKLPAEVRHFTLMLISALLAWGIDSVPSFDLNPAVAGFIGVILTQILAFVTPLTRQYGIGYTGD
jgi:hypothetical protein